MKQSLLILVSLFLMVRVFAQTPWAVSGNSGLTTSNFIGTTDNVPLILKVNNQWAGFTGHQDKSNVSFGYLSLANALGTGEANTALGAQALRWNSAGSGNVAIGRWALEWCTEGDNNVAMGLGAMGNSMTPGSYNVSIGYLALFNNKQSGNTAVGTEAGLNNTEGSSLTALGFKALRNNVNGNQNTALGFNALVNNTKGNNNTAVGALTLVDNTSGDHNTAIGAKTLFRNTTGEYNTAIGVQALELNTSGLWNAALGSGALNQNTTGSRNTAGGNSAMWFNQTGNDNVALGEEALGGNFHGSFNTAIGSRALWSVENTSSGAVAFGHGQMNTAVGYEALREISTGSYNVGMGVHVLRVNSSGSDNIGMGCYSLTNNTTGGNNVALGNQALSSNISGNDNVAIGNWTFMNITAGNRNTVVGTRAGISHDNLTNATAIGYGAMATESNQVFIGNHDVTSIRSYAHLTTISDARVKKNIKEDVPGLDFINKLQPVTYELDLDAINRLQRSDKSQENKSNSSMSNSSEIKTRSAKHEQRQSGFIAQHVEEAAKSVGYDFNGVDVDESHNALYGLRYSKFIIPLVKAVQELSDRINAKDETIAALQKRIEQLESGDNNSAMELLHAHVEQWSEWEHDHSQLSCDLDRRIGELNVIADSTIDALQTHVDQWGSWEHDHQKLSNALQTQITDLNETAVRLEAYHLPTSTNNITPSPSANTFLEQNYPNPFNQSTTINYTLPQYFQSAKIIIIDMSGKIVKQVPLSSEPGKGSIKIDAGSLPAGTYFYSLNVDNSVIDTKKMVLTK